MENGGIMDPDDYLFIFVYVTITAALSLGYGWLLNSSLLAYAVAMPFMVAGLLICVAAMFIVIDGPVYKSQLFYTGTFWFYGQLLLTGLGKFLLWIGLIDLGTWIYEHRLLGLPLGLSIMSLGVTIFVINEYFVRRTMRTT